MKCRVCDYEYKWDWVNNKKVTMKGNKGDWIQIRIQAHIFVIDSEDGWNDDKETEIYACPNCGIIRLNDFDVRMLVSERE